MQASRHEPWIQTGQCTSLKKNKNQKLHTLPALYGNSNNAQNIGDDLSAPFWHDSARYYLLGAKYLNFDFSILAKAFGSQCWNSAVFCLLKFLFWVGAKLCWRALCALNTLEALNQNKFCGFLSSKISFVLS